MPITQPAAPGVYLIEPPPAVPHQVQPATTSVAAFPGVFPTGEVGVAVEVSSWDDFVTQYGGLSDSSSLAALAVWQFFQNGGGSAYIVRLQSDDMAYATARIGGIVLTALTPGASANQFQVGLRPSKALGAGTSAVDFIVASALPPHTPVETLMGLDWHPDALAAGIRAGSSYFSAVKDPSVGQPYAPVPRAVGFTRDPNQADGNLTAQVAGMTLTPAGPWYQHVTVTLEKSTSDTSDLLDLVVKQGKNGAAGVVLEHLYDLRTHTAEQMLHDLKALQYFKPAESPSGRPWRPPSPGEVNVSSGSGAVGTLLEITAVKTPPWQQGLTVQLIGDAEKQTATLVLTNSTSTGPARLELLPGLPVGGGTQANGEATPGATDQSDESTEDSADSPAIEGSKPAQANDSSTQELVDAINNNSIFLTAAVGGDTQPFKFPPKPVPVSGGSDGTWTTTELRDALLAQFGKALALPAPIPALDQISPNVFNLMCIPDTVWMDVGDQIEVLENAQEYCQQHQAFLIVDPPAPVGTPLSRLFDTAPTLTLPPLGNDVARQAFLQSEWKTNLFGEKWYCGATYYPWLRIPSPSPTPGSQPIAVPPSGTVAGIYAATDAARAVWKAPAGINAELTGILGLADITMSEAVNADLNSAGINCLRTFAVYGSVVWGARTMAGADLLQSGWKYVPVRRLADFIEQSLIQSLKWAVFEPNNASLWASITLEVVAFMNSLYGQGAFGGTSAATAYQVVCDATTTSPADQLAGVVNVLVGFQPVEPAEFVVLTVQLNAGTPASS